MIMVTRLRRVSLRITGMGRIARLGRITGMRRIAGLGRITRMRRITGLRRIARMRRIAGLLGESGLHYGIIIPKSQYHS